MATQPGALQPMPASWQLYLPNVAYNAQDRRALLFDDLLRALSGRDGWQLVRRLRAYLPQASPPSCPLTVDGAAAAVMCRHACKHGGCMQMDAHGCTWHGLLLSLACCSPSLVALSGFLL
jgi:hypothetical protein